MDGTILAVQSIEAMSSPSVNTTFRAFSDPLRLRILHLLSDGELCVGDLVTILAVPQPTASRHLAYLRRAGLVQVRRSQSWSFYRLAPPRSKFHSKLLECLESCFPDVSELAADIKKAKRLKRSGGCCPE